MAISHVFPYMKLPLVVPIVCCMSCAWDLVSVMCGIMYVLREGCNARAQACVMCGL